MRTLVFDLDGTLVDTVPDLRSSLNRLMAAHRLAPFSVPEVTAMIGHGAAALVRDAMAARGRAAEQADIDAFLGDYGVHATEASRPFEGVVAGLTRLRAEGWRMAVCTNKPVAPARALLDALGLREFFHGIGGGDSFPTRKPDPAHLLSTIAAAGGEPRQSVMVGDHSNDVEAGRGAGVPVIFALWGYGPERMAEGAQARAARFADVPALAATLSGRYT